MQYDKHPSSIERLISLNPDKPIALNFKMLKLSNKDNLIIREQILKNPKIFDEVPLKDIEPKLKFLVDQVRDNSCKANSLYANITGNILGNIKTYSEFSYDKLYLSPFYHNYLTAPNSIFLKGNFSILNKRFSLDQSKIKEDELSGSVKFSLDNLKTSVYFSNLIFTDKYEIETKIKKSLFQPDIRRKQINNSFKATISRNVNERPFLFRENLKFDLLNKINLQYSHKSIRNQVDEFNCSPEYLAKLPVEDSQHQIKLFYTLNKTLVEDRNIVFLKASTSLINSLNSTFLRNKIFFRKFFIFDPLTLQLNLELGNVINLKGGNEKLKVHERLHVNNFRGIANPSEKISMHEGKSNSGDSLGVNNYIMLQNKIMFNNIPLLNSTQFLKKDWQINPFVHFNFLWTPELSHFKDLNENRKNLQDAFRFSAGFGFSLLTKLFAIEVYYNAFVEKSSKDVKREFSVRLGVD